VSSDVTIRDGRPEDAAAVAALLCQLGYPQPSVEAVAERIRRFAAAASDRVLVAESGGEVLGSVSVSTLPHFERDESFARMTSLVVHDGSRGRGIGQRLVRAAEAHAIDCGCTTIEVSSSRRRHDAHAFYRALGYGDITERSGVFRKPLARNGEEQTTRG
jgi:predicted N-acetyltransferase YhbS